MSQLAASHLGLNKDNTPDALDLPLLGRSLSTSFSTSFSLSFFLLPFFLWHNVPSLVRKLTPGSRKISGANWAERESGKLCMTLPIVGQVSTHTSHDPHRQLFPTEAIAHKFFHLNPINGLYPRTRHRASSGVRAPGLKYLFPLVKR